MLKKYGIGLGLAAVFAFVLIAPAQAYNVRFDRFFEKFTPWTGSVLGEKVETEAVSSAVPMTDQAQPIRPIDQVQPLPSIQPNQSEQPVQSDQQNQPGQFSPDQPQQPTQPNQPMKPNQDGQSFKPNQSGQPGQDGQQFQPNQSGQPGGEQGYNDAQRLKDMQRSIKPLQNTLNNFNRLIQQGTKPSDELLAKLEEAKTLASKISSAQSGDDVSNEDMDSLRDLMNTLEEERQGLQRLKEFRTGIKMTENGVKNFEKQISRMIAQKITIPAEVSDNLNKIKEMINIVKSAKSWQEMQDAGIEDMGEMMSTLNQSREILDMLSRWPQTLKQVDRQIASLTSQLKKSKTIVDRLLKKNIDLSSDYADFSASVDKLKAVRVDAAAKMAAGEAQEAFDLLQNDFFDQMDEVNKPAQTIQMMNNLGGFSSNFRSSLAQEKSAINKLKKKKIDTAGLEEIYQQTQSKGNELLALIKTKPLDQEAVMAGLDEMGGLQSDFSNMMSDLSGDDGADMPWEQGKSQFQEVKMAPNFNKSYLPMMKQTTNAGATNAKTCNVNGEEMPGDCSQYNNTK